MPDSWAPPGWSLRSRFAPPTRPGPPSAGAAGFGSRTVAAMPPAGSPGCSACRAPDRRPRARRAPVGWAPADVRWHHQLRGNRRMIVALWLLAIQGAIGAFDTVYYHEWRARLPARGKQAASELKLHAARDFFYAV